jgi:hypothetical protein
MVIDAATPAPQPDPVPAMLAFLEEIGIACDLVDLDGSTLLPGLRILQGRLLVDRARLMFPGDILHEAAHIAVSPAAERPHLGPDGLDNPGLEIAALAWSYAACLRLGMPPELVFHADGYKGGGASILEAFSSGATLGQPLLAWMGLTTYGPGADPKQAFPVMARWLRG